MNIRNLSGISILASAIVAGAAPEVSLKELARAKSLLIGSAVDSTLLPKDKQYAQFVQRELSIIAPIDEMKFKSLQPAKGKYDFSRMEALVKFAKENAIQVRTFAPVWGNPKSLPKWLTRGHYTPSQLRKILKDHLQNVIAHFRADTGSVINYWEVANEVFNSKGNFKDSIWSAVESDPVQFLKLVFTWAHEANPDAKLFYNEGGAEFPGKKLDATYEAMKSLKDSGVPIHGIGFQVHLGWDETFNRSELEKTFNKFAALGLEIHITEFDVALADSDKFGLDKQAALFGDVTEVCLKQPACKAIVMWGFTDKYSWIPAFKPGFGRATFLNEKFEPKPAYFKLKGVLQK